jgi:uncharacterized membrane protein YoaT (DUF817 family)
VREFIREFLLFGLKEARACIFAGSFLAILLVSKQLPLGDFPRYDFLFLSAVALQIVLLVTRIETREELAVLCCFHAVGMGLELFKTSPAIHSWSYPEPAFFKLGTVPLYSGFMYAAVASYMCQAWRIFKLDLKNYPSYWLSIPLGLAIYANYFTHHYIPDLRWWLIGAVFVVFGRCVVEFTVIEGRPRRMPLVLSFALIGFFIWVAENIATFFGAWVYPHQQSGWQTVSWRILTSWFLLTIISFILVADLKVFRERLAQAEEPGGTATDLPCDAAG